MRCLPIALVLLAWTVVWASPAEAESKTTVLPAPDGSVLYVRYGEPGGVRIVNRFTATDSIPEPDPQPEPAASVAEPSPAQPPDWTGLIRELLRDELRVRPGYSSSAPVTREVVGDGPTLLDVEVGRGLAPRESPETDATQPGPAVIDTRGTAPSLIVPDDGRAAGSTPANGAVTPGPIPTPEVIRQRILDDGLFRTNLVLFETSRADLLPRSQDVLQVIGDVLRGFPEAQVRVEGHADRRGSDEFNLALSQRRAETVRAFLLDCCGLRADHVVAKGYGESRPIASGNSPTALALNRRVEFRILNPGVLRR